MPSLHGPSRVSHELPPLIGPFSHLFYGRPTCPFPKSTLDHDTPCLQPSIPGSQDSDHVPQHTEAGPPPPHPLAGPAVLGSLQHVYAWPSSWQPSVSTDSRAGWFAFSQDGKIAEEASGLEKD